MVSRHDHHQTDFRGSTITYKSFIRIERYTKHNNVNLKVIDYKPTGSVSGVLGQFLAVDSYQVKKLDENKGQLLRVSQSHSYFTLFFQTTSPSDRNDLLMTYFDWFWDH